MLGVHRASATRCRWRFSPWRSPAARCSSSRWRAPSVSRWRSRSRRCSLFRERSSVVLLRLRSVGPPGRAGFVALLAPLMVLASPRPAAPSHEVVTAVDIDAPPAVVWRHVVTFPELPLPREWLFRAGGAAPRRARIEGTGGGATRYCAFTTGRFGRPIH